jgi:phosphoglycolate phosphatase-like HAD superfamily hydrolase
MAHIAVEGHPMSDTTSYSVDDLRNLIPRHAYLACIDSDGCVFDTMKVKQTKFFHTRIIEIWGLEAIEPCVRKVAEFINLYSQSRGQNRFQSLVQLFEMLPARPEIKDADLKLPVLKDLKAFVTSGKPLGNPSLQEELDRTGSEELATVMEWSKTVNNDIATKMGRIPPFEWALKAMDKIKDTSDMIVVSQTPEEALVREWDENNLTDHLSVIAGQELGTKSEHIQFAAKDRYPPKKVLMIGDAPGDQKAAKANKACFYPINPGKEEASWERFCNEAYSKFIDGTYKGAYEAAVIAEFNELLPKDPPWQT